jgi:hypothetical protein
VTHFAFPFQIDDTGRVARVDEEAHVRQMIEQLLFTIPGERVNRPTFGSATESLVFQPNNSEVATSVQYLIQGALQRWLADDVLVEGIQVEADDAVLRVRVQYTRRRTGEVLVVDFERGEIP